MGEFPFLEVSSLQTVQFDQNMQRMILLTIFSLALVGNAHPCFMARSDFPDAFTSSRGVFIGEVLRVEEISPPPSHPPLRTRLYRVVFNVEYSWKGAGFQEVGIQGLVVLSKAEEDPSQPDDSFCLASVELQPGKKYLVYAEETPAKELIVNPGTRTMLLDAAADDLKNLRRVYTFFDSPLKPGPH